ncbi:MAG: response regulator transcription factor [Pseudopedobacter sp.]|nr:response regulator transcription factor [Deinococcales bacterium]
MMQRVLVVDDDPSVRNFLKRGLAYEGFAVDLAESGEVGLRMARERQPDFVILDLMMPGIDGLEVLRRLRAVDESLPVIMLTAKDTPEDQIKGLETGADDYVVKPVSFEVLLARIRALLRRRGKEVGGVLRFDDLTLDPSAFTVRRGNRNIQLTSVEFKLLQEFMEQPDRVLPKQTLLDRVWGLDFFGDVNVVEVYVKQLRQKLEAEEEPRLIHTIRNVGYVMRRT